MKSVLKLGALALVVGVISCGEGDKSDILSPELVSNPATASTEKVIEVQAKMVFSDAEQDFGSIVQGESITKIYHFKNEGDVDLIISSANGSCGCTIPKWPKTPIKVGQSGEIEVIFNSQGKKGKQTKKVYITANTHPINNVIVLKGDVVAPE
jgi:hypothetical protein